VRERMGEKEIKKERYGEWKSISKQEKMNE